MSSKDMSAAGKNQQPEGASEVVEVTRRSRRRHKGAHGSAWKVAYADLVTAMMALFIVLWVLNQGQSVRDAVSSIEGVAEGKLTWGGGSEEDYKFLIDWVLSNMKGPHHGTQQVQVTIS